MHRGNTIQLVTWFVRNYSWDLVRVKHDSHVVEVGGLWFFKVNAEVSNHNQRSTNLRDERNVQGDNYKVDVYYRNGMCFKWGVLQKVVLDK